MLKAAPSLAFNSKVSSTPAEICDLINSLIRYELFLGLAEPVRFMHLFIRQMALFPLFVEASFVSVSSFRLY